MALQPIVIKLYNEDKKNESFRILRKTIFFQLVVFVFFIIILIFIKDKFVINFLNIENKEAIKLVLPIFIGAFLWSVSMLIHKPLELANKTYLMLIGVIIALIVNFVGNVIFIPKYGYLVAAYTTIISSVIYLMYIFLVIKIRKKNIV